MTTLVEVTQADRDLAAKHTMRCYGKIGGYTYSAEYMLRNGHWDDDELVQDAGRHRLTAEWGKDAEIAERDALLREARDRIAAMICERCNAPSCEAAREHIARLNTIIAKQDSDHAS